MDTQKGLLDKIPIKQTPLWAVGLVSLIVALSASFVVMYSTIQPEIRQRLSAQEKLDVMVNEAEQSSMATILKLVVENTQQITGLSNALNFTNAENSKLQERVTQMEKDLAVTLEKLKNCEEKLAID